MMRFYTGELKFDELYYDCKSRMITFARKLNGKFWGKRWKDCYLAFTKCTMACIVYVAASADSKKDIEELRKYFRKMVEELEDAADVKLIREKNKKLTLEEVTLNYFMETVKDDDYGLLDNNNAMLKEIGLKKGARICSEYLLDMDYWDRSNREYLTGVLDKQEISRIQRGRQSTEENWTQPVHYLINEQDVKISEDIAREVIFYLCAWGRMDSRRVVKLDKLSWYERLTSSKIANLNTLDEGIVIIQMTKDESEDDFKKLLSDAYGEGKYVVIVLWNVESSPKDIIRRCCPQWTFVSVQNHKMKKSSAIKYFEQCLNDEGLVVGDTSWKGMFDVKGEFTKKEVNDMFHNWKHYKYNIEHFFPQYTDVISRYHYPATASGTCARKELEEMIGLEEVKKTIKNIIEFFKVQKIRYAKNPNIEKPTMHMVFYGNPGTAKTTVARLLGQIFKEERILEKGDFYEVGRADLVGQYVGWTAKEVQKYFAKAKDSVLFVDEAYSLVEEHDSFGKEAIDTIVQEMENHRNDVVVILAGYPKDMQKLLDKNQGLRSRIAFCIDFPDYSEEELYAILEKNVRKEGMALDENVRKRFLNTIRQCDTSKGNGRIVRNILDSAKLKQAGRISRLPKKQLMEEMMLLKECDFI